MIVTTGGKSHAYLQKRRRRKGKEKGTNTWECCVGKRAFIAGVADDNGYGWAIAKSLAAAGAEILVGTWVPVSKSA